MKRIRNHLLLFTLTVITALIFALPKNASALSNQFAALPSIGVRAANNIYFVEDCVSSRGRKSSGACGDNAREIYWSVLSQHFDTIQVAGIFGNIDNEGGFSPTKWQYNLVASPGAPLKRSFDELYNWPACSGSDCAGGVGSFQITSALGPYLRYIGQEAPDLLDYFKDTKYSANGDEVLKIMPKDAFIELVEMEVKYVMDVHLDKSAINDFKSKTDPGDAARWWSVNYERCNECTSWGSAENNERAAAAKQEYEAMGNYSCTPSNSSTSTAPEKNANDEDENEDDGNESTPPNTSSNDGITWIGDSYSVAAKNKGLLNKFSDVDFGSGIDTSSSNIQVAKFVSSDSSNNPSCLSILEKTIKANKLKPTLVFACGTNGGWSDSDIAKFKNLLKNTNTKAVVVNSKIPSNNYADSNKKLKELTDDNDNINLADWVSVYKDDFFSSDPEKIHPYTDPGFEKWVEAISDAINGVKTNCSTATYQGDYPNYPQQTDHTCGPASMAMLATVAAGKDITEADVIKTIGGDDRAYVNTGGAGMTALDKKIGDKYGFEVVNVPYNSLDDAEAKMKQYLDDGYMLHFSGAGNRPFSEGGHYIGVFGWTDKKNNKVMLANSGYGGNAEANLHDVIHAGLHYDFSAIKGKSSSDICEDDERPNQCTPDSESDSSNDRYSSCSAKVLQTVEDLIALAQKNGSHYTYGGIRDANGFKSILNNGAFMSVDCTGFASLVMYSAFGIEESFWTGSIAGNSNYKEVPKSDIQPGDIFAYNYGCTAHGGIIIEVNNGRVTKIAQTGRASYITEGFGGKNDNIGYTSDPSGNAGNMNCVNGGASDVKYYRYKGCN